MFIPELESGYCEPCSAQSGSLAQSKVNIEIWGETRVDILTMEANIRGWTAVLLRGVESLGAPVVSEGSPYSSGEQ